MRLTVFLFSCLLCACSSNWTHITQAEYGKEVSDHFKNLSLYKKSDSNLKMNNPFEHIILMDVNDSFEKYKDKCNLIKDISSSSKGNLQKDKVEFDYAIENLLSITLKEGGEILKITQIEPKFIKASIYNCD